SFQSTCNVTYHIAISIQSPREVRGKKSNKTNRKKRREDHGRNHNLALKVCVPVRVPFKLSTSSAVPSSLSSPKTSSWTPSTTSRQNSSINPISPPFGTVPASQFSQIPNLPRKVRVESKTPPVPRLDPPTRSSNSIAGYRSVRNSASTDPCCESPIRASEGAPAPVAGDAGGGGAFDPCAIASSNRAQPLARSARISDVARARPGSRGLLTYAPTCRCASLARCQNKHIGSECRKPGRHTLRYSSAKP
ncbi:unnamed protein product, partial [Mycena citricolor]